MFVISWSLFLNKILANHSTAVYLPLPCQQAPDDPGPGFTKIGYLKQPPGLVAAADLLVREGRAHPKNAPAKSPLYELPSGHASDAQAGVRLIPPPARGN